MVYHHAIPRMVERCNGVALHLSGNWAVGISSWAQAWTHEIGGIKISQLLWTSRYRIQSMAYNKWNANWHPSQTRTQANEMNIAPKGYAARIPRSPMRLREASSNTTKILMQLNSSCGCPLQTWRKCNEFRWTPKGYLLRNRCESNEIQTDPEGLPLQNRCRTTKFNSYRAPLAR